MDVVTGAFSFTGRAIAELLLGRGDRVRTLTRRIEAGDPLAARLETAELQFRDRGRLVDALRGARTLYNTYWIRFPHGGTTFEHAVANTRELFEAAREAGVERIVHISVTNPSAESPFPYFRAKARLERDLAQSGLSYAVVRPTLIFGPKDILVNNIAWILRRFPFFLLPGSGRYRVQPVSVRDTAAIAVAAGGAVQGQTLDAAGPDTYTFAELVRAVAGAVGSRARIVRTPPRLALALTRLVGRSLGDVVLTRDELGGLMAGLLVSSQPSLGRERFADWLAEERTQLGRAYVSELARNFRPYAPL